MYVKSIIIDGFKTYGKKTELTGFDKSFNAITGLNGSGKSNILDAICFVLGLSNMGLARVSNLRELIYKNGQTGITKASVAITFDNRDKSQSPPGYEDCESIVVRREVNMDSRTKYFIEGFTAPNNQVLDLFHSVGLNIHNPHFLIMQGRITKVLNMKPNEILAMVEEATGVSMYEAKKKSTRATIEKKDHALRNIDNLINETILPKLDQLTQEQSSLLEYQKICIELENLTKIYTAWQFIKYEEMSQQTESKIREKNLEIERKKDEITLVAEKIENLENEIETITKKKDQEFGGKLTDLEAELKDAQMLEGKLLGELNIKKDNLNEVIKQKNQLLKSVKDDTKHFNVKSKDYEKLRKVFEELEETRKKNNKALEQAQNDLEAIASGLSRGEDGEATATIADQLIQAKRETAEAQVEMTKAEMIVKHCKEELSKKQKEASQKKGSYETELKNVEAMDKEVQKLKKKFESVNYDEKLCESLRSEREGLNSNLNEVQDSIYNLERSIPQANFNYRPPNDPRFDPKKVHGPVCTLFKVKNPTHYVALEAVAGGKLYNIVVKDKATGKLILEKGQLQRRHTFLPLDAIRGREVDEEVLKNAQRIVGKENVFRATDLVECDEMFTEVKNFVFGGTLVCIDKNIANKITFARNVRTRTVTLEGDIFDPAGTLTGGARGQKGHVLSGIAELMRLKETASDYRENLARIEKRLDSIKDCEEVYNSLKKEYDLRLHELDLRRNNLKNTNEHLLSEEIENLKKSIDENQELVQNLSQKRENFTKKIEDLEFKIKNTKSIREKELKEAEAGLEKAKKECEITRKNTEEKEQQVYCLKLEIDELKKTLDDYDTQIKELDESIELHKKAVDDASLKVDETKRTTDALREQVKEQKRVLNTHSAEINRLIKLKESMARKSEDEKLLIKKIKHEISQIENEGKDASKAVHHMLKKYPWIKEERHLFGAKNSGYDFKSSEFNLPEMEKRLKKLESTKGNLSKTVNMRANVMLGDKQKESEELNKKRQIIELDKKKLLRYMEEVDKKKQDALQDAWEKINKDFGNIFSTLLPGSTAKLAPPEGQSIADGLEVKVAFGDIWKESLTELSGGQRSLVALSLILALLLYNPAPLYILDEVDAALDQSHTTNIGAMIKKHFTNSQFIIVSLKDDMFNNANVLFRTKFVDGCSTVSRFTKGDR